MIFALCKYKYAAGYTKLQVLRVWHRRGTCVILVKEGTNRDWSCSEDQIFDEHWS